MVDYSLSVNGSNIPTDELMKNNKKVGLASLCIGGGMGTAIIVKAC